MVARQNTASFSVKCLMWQYEQLRRMPLDGVNAAPLEGNIFEWHGNFYFSEDHKHFPSMIIHFMLTLPQNYPNGTPDMRLLTSFPHSHVFGDTICFSLLSEFQWWFTDLPTTAYWNPARTVRQLLESIYIFLTVDEDKHVTISEKSASRARHDALKGHCQGCGHEGGNGKICPPEEAWLAARSTSETEQTIASLAMHEDIASEPPKPSRVARPPSVPSLPKKALVVDLSEMIEKEETSKRGAMRGLDEKLAILKAKAKILAYSTQSSSLEDFRCSITGTTFDHSDQVILGFGVYVERRPNDGSIASINTDLEPISFAAFTLGKIRKSPLGMTISHFFPFAINEPHWAKARRILHSCIDAIIQGTPESTNISNPDERLLFVIGELWKSMAVLLMKGEAHASEKVLKGFCAFHHILLLATEEPDPFSRLAEHQDQMLALVDINENASAVENRVEDGDNDWNVVVRKRRTHTTKQTMNGGLLGLAQSSVNSFVKSPRGRHKSKCPDFGRFLPLILLSDLSWNDIKQPFVEELLARNAKWALKNHPRLRTVQAHEFAIPSQPASLSWGASATGLKLTAFQIRFALNALPWAQRALPTHVFEAHNKTCRSGRTAIRAMYNALGGRPTQEMMLKFQNEVKWIESMNQYEDFFRNIQMPLNEMEIQTLLCRAIKRSEECRYHR